MPTKIKLGLYKIFVRHIFKAWRKSKQTGSNVLLYIFLQSFSDNYSHTVKNINLDSLSGFQFDQKDNFNGGYNNRVLEI